MEDLERLLIDQLQDRYSAAVQQKNALEQLSVAADNKELKDFIIADIEAKKSHLDKLKSLLEREDAKAVGEFCEATAGLINEALFGLTLFKDAKKYVMDINISISIQHINHHDIAGYNGCAILANELGKTDLEAALLQMLEDEKKADITLTGFMKKILKTK